MQTESVMRSSDVRHRRPQWTRARDKTDTGAKQHRARHEISEGDRARDLDVEAQ